MPDDDAPTVIWAYAGKIFTGKKIYDVWLDEGHIDPFDPTHAHLFQKISGVIGGLYEAKFAGGTLIGKPTWLGRWAEPSLRTDWAVRDSAHNTRYRQYRNAERAKKNKPDPIDTALVPLLDLARRTRIGADRDALIATVIRRMTGVW